jgi:hypothetical protein
MSTCTAGPASSEASAAAAMEAARPAGAVLPDPALAEALPLGALPVGVLPVGVLLAGPLATGVVTVPPPLLVQPASRHVAVIAGTIVASTASADAPRGRLIAFSCLIAFISASYQSCRRDKARGRGPYPQLSGKIRHNRPALAMPEAVRQGNTRRNR